MKDRSQASYITGATLAWYPKSSVQWMGARPDHHYGVEGRLDRVEIGKSLPSQQTEERW